MICADDKRFGKQLGKLAGLAAIAVMLAGFGLPVRAELSVGDPAPDFTLLGSDGVTYTLSDFEGKQAVVLAFFPKAFTGG